MCKLAITLQTVHQSSQFFTAGKPMKLDTKGIKYFQPHLMYVAALPWKVKSPNLLEVTKELN